MAHRNGTSERPTLAPESIDLPHPRSEWDQQAWGRVPFGTPPLEDPLTPAQEVRFSLAPQRLFPAFAAIYADAGRPSIPPEKLRRALLQALFTVRSERQLVQQITYNMLFRWFVGLAMDAPVWDVAVFTKNHDRLLEGDIARGFLAAILADPQMTRCFRASIFRWTGP